MNKHATLLALVLGLSSFNFNHAITNSTAYTITGVTGTTSFLGGYFLKSQLPISPSLRSLTWGLGSAAITGIAYLITKYMTPEARLKRARKTIDSIENHLPSYQSNREFFDIIDEIYVTSEFPLVSAYLSLVDSLNNAHAAKNLLCKAKEDAYDDFFLSRECEQELKRVNTIISTMNNMLRIIKKNEAYVAQYTIYAEAQQIAAMNRLAMAQMLQR